jgi:hypothetical protein
MPDQNDVRRIAMALPGTVEEQNRFAFSIASKGKIKGYAWVWLERVQPKKARVPQPEVLAVRVANLDEKAVLLSMGSEALFTEPHYNGYPAVLVRLSKVEMSLLEELITQAWRSQAPRELIKQFDIA